MVWCGASEKTWKVIREMWKWSYKMLVKNDLLRIFLAHHAWFWSSRHLKKVSALNFFISTSKIQLAEEPSLYRTLPVKGYSVQKKINGVGKTLGYLLLPEASFTVTIRAKFLNSQRQSQCGPSPAWRRTLSTQAPSKNDKRKLGSH
jgi:hypothetical protein